MMISLSTDCKIVDGDAQNYESLQPTNVTGYFGYPITCNGTLVAVNATGFCILTERTTHHRVALSLIIYWEDNGVPMTILHLIPADCDFSNINSVSGLDYSFGSASDNNLNIPVTSDMFIAIQSFATCNDIGGCFFQPAIINDTSKHMLLYLEYGEPVNETGTLSNVSLLFSATIISKSSGTSGREGIYTIDDVYWCDKSN